jgi:flavin-dependent dehydrogenase
MEDGRKMIYDLIIIGGGPAGCAAAITAAQTGASVLLLERGRFPRHKVCGEFVSAESLHVLEKLLGPGNGQFMTDSLRISRGRIFSDGSTIPVEINPAAASISRFDLDAALWESCVRNGVEARQGSSVQRVSSTGPFKVECANEQFLARAVINAAGRWSPFTSAEVRARLTKARWIGIKAHFYETSSPSSVDLYFFEGGYCGVQPVVSEDCARVNACAMVRADVATSLEQVLNLHPALRERSREWQPFMAPITTSPLVFHKPEPLQHRKLQVGDAATFVDPFIGDGISLALRSGVLATKCLAPFFANQCSLDAAAREYSEHYQKNLASVFRASSLLRKMLSTPGFVRRPVMSWLQKTPAITRRLVQMTR